MNLTIGSIVRSTAALSITCLVLLGLGPAVAVGKDYNGNGGGELTTKDAGIGEVNGRGNWIIWGVGQDLSIRLKDGPGSLTLHGFKNITIKEKNGEGKLIVEEDNESITLGKVNGPGDVYLRNKAAKTIGDKDGPGNVFFKGAPPIIEGPWNGSGESRRE